jgi:hypothetical protein
MPSASGDWNSDQGLRGLSQHQVAAQMDGSAEFNRSVSGQRAMVRLQSRGQAFCIVVKRNAAVRPNNIQPLNASREPSNCHFPANWTFSWP